MCCKVIQYELWDLRLFDPIYSLHTEIFRVALMVSDIFGRRS